ncbi:MAG TPA: di-heme oxidoredictase family protein [Longimicrobiales bacterium]|nr:di-heme oxidoredictase family protein [Longimicrobiales bacterium]
MAAARPAAFLIGCCAILAAGCDSLITQPPSDADLFDAPIAGLTREQQAAFVRGDQEFGRRFSIADGLGPIFNNISCADCHSGDGRGRPENALTRFSRAGDPVPELGGPQLQTRAIPGAVPETLPPGVEVSVRMPPPVFGAGLIEAIPDSVLLALEDPDDRDGDGISGRANRVHPPAWLPTGQPGSGPGPRVGRFSRKAQVAGLVQQVTEAYHQDIGITSDFLPVENLNPAAAAQTSAADRVADPEIPASTVLAVVDYLRMLAPPAPGEETAARARGGALFREVGCASCHVPELRTGAHAIAALADQPVRLYSDLLLPDMGDELADGRVDGEAEGREWRTAPLWGLRVMRDFLNGDVFLLHDGRAHSIEEAVDYHGGEAAAARAAFRALSPEERSALVDFVGSR